MLPEPRPNQRGSPLFDNRARPHTHPIDVLAEAQDEIKGWFSSGLVARLDELGGSVDDGFAMFGIHLARAGAWQASQMMWDLLDNPRLDAVFRRNLARGVALASRGILI